MDKPDLLTAFDVSYRLDLDTGLTDFLETALTKGRVLTVAADRPAIDLARQVEETKADVVIVVDDSGTTCGYVFPEWIVSQVTALKAQSVSSFVDTIGVLAEEPLDLGRDHFHEWLNYTRPVEQECPGPPAHITLGPVPCRNHR